MISKKSQHGIVVYPAAIVLLTLVVATVDAGRRPFGLFLSKKSSIMTASSSSRLPAENHLDRLRRTIMNMEDDESDEEDFCLHDLNNAAAEPLLQLPCSVQLRQDDYNDDDDLDLLDDNHNFHAMATCCDTGAQRSVMSYQAAQELGILHLMDRRYAGHAMGVGSCRVLGRIPAKHLILRLSQDLAVEAPPITILEKMPGVQLLLGLDFLREYKAILNLEDESLLLNVKGRKVRICFFSREELQNQRSSHPRINDDDYASSNQESYQEEYTSTRKKRHEIHNDLDSVSPSQDDDFSETDDYEGVDMSGV